jgi:hypothetical protein
MEKSFSFDFFYIISPPNVPITKDPQRLISNEQISMKIKKLILVLPLGKLEMVNVSTMISTKFMKGF